MLVDTVTINVKGGRGGDGAVSFRREKYIPKGGPDGGNGGNGGDVYALGVDNIRLLKKFRERKVIEADIGTPGQGQKKSGKNAPDTTIYIPTGTKITNLNTQQTLDVMHKNQKILLARGGRGGRGNWEFRSATNQTPRTAEKGTNGQEFQYKLELLMIADVGLIGLPNVGKSSLLNALTKAHAKTANYHFTTLEPNLGTLDSLIIADIPGLIEGASKGKGLGIQFLKHIERTRLLVHCLSAHSPSPANDYAVIRQELKEYNPKLLTIPEIIVFTKSDLYNTADKTLQQEIKKISSEPFFISIVDEVSLEKLKQKLLTVL